MTDFLKQVQACNTIVTHDSCADGTSSALLLKDALPHAEVVFLQYGTEKYHGFRPEDGRSYIFCDLSPNKWIAPEFVERGAIVLDHHTSAKQVVELFGERGVFADEQADPGVSGALLAYTRVWLPLRGKEVEPHLFSFATEFAGLNSVYDTWQQADRGWDRACEVVKTMHFLPNTEWVKLGLERMAEQWESKFKWLGPVLVDKGLKSSRKSAESIVIDRTQNGLRVGMVNTRAVNELPALCPEADLIVGFGFEVIAGELKLVMSMRSRMGFDCAALAKRHGGGGHRAAAGMSVAMHRDDSPYQTIMRLVCLHDRIARAGL